MKRFQYLRISAYICGLMVFVLLSGLDHEADKMAEKYKGLLVATDGHG
jgi:hypothetical protein